MVILGDMVQTDLNTVTFWETIKIIDFMNILIIVGIFFMTTNIYFSKDEKVSVFKKETDFFKRVFWFLPVVIFSTLFFILLVNTAFMIAFNLDIVYRISNESMSFVDFLTINNLNKLLFAILIILSITIIITMCVDFLENDDNILKTFLRAITIPLLSSFLIISTLVITYIIIKIF